MEAKVRLASRTACAVAMGLLVFGTAACAAAQTPENTQIEWRNERLDLKFLYPGDFVLRPPVEALKDGHLMVFGIPGKQLPELAEKTKCLQPLLELEIPTSGGTADETKVKNADGSVTITVKPPLLGTILLAELLLECLTPQQQAQVKPMQLETGMVHLVTEIPGMRPTMQPAMYLVGKQKMLMAGAQGVPKVAEDADTPADPLFSYTTGFSTNWNNHLLVWYFSSNSAATLNRMTHSMVKFGNNPAIPIYPLQVGYTRR